MSLFLAFLLIVGTITTIFESSIIKTAQAIPDIILEKYKSKYFPIKKYDVNCNNFNLNFNGGGLDIDGIAETLNILAEADKIGGTSIKTNTFDNGEKRLGFDKDFAFVCINNNENEQFKPTPPSPVGTETLTVIKNVECQADSEICVQNPIQPSDFTITIHGKNPSQTSFPGSSTGTNVELEPGPYSVSEEGLQTPVPRICTQMQYGAGSSLGNNLFICTNF